MYELFILGELMDAPMHGYLLREIIHLAIGPVRRMSWGALYPLIRRLERDGLIEIEGEREEATKGERQRKVYRITPQGRERFFFLLLRPDDFDAEFADGFNAKLIHFARLTPGQRRDQFERYRNYIQFVLARLTDGRRFVVTETHISDDSKEWILRNLDHRLHLAQADFAWVTEQIEMQ